MQKRTVGGEFIYIYMYIYNTESSANHTTSTCQTAAIDCAYEKYRVYRACIVIIMMEETILYIRTYYIALARLIENQITRRVADLKETSGTIYIMYYNI